MSEFYRFHPFVNLAYFALVISFSCFFMHPVCITVSLLGGFTYLLLLKGKHAAFRNLSFVILCFVSTAVINPLFSHEGITVITYFPNGNPLTLESVIYGICMGEMLVSVVLHFSCFNEVMTSDKIIYLFGKIMPSLSLVVSMTLRFVPRLLSQLKVIINAEKCMGHDITCGSIIRRAKCGLSILSAITSRALESSIETADSMKARGYGHKGRTAFSIFTFKTSDVTALSVLVLLGIYTVIGSLSGQMYFRVFPSVTFCEMTPFSLSAFISYSLICFYPVIIELWEVRRWKLLRSKI